MQALQAGGEGGGGGPGDGAPLDKAGIGRHLGTARWAWSFVRGMLGREGRRGGRGPRGIMLLGWDGLGRGHAG